MKWIFVVFLSLFCSVTTEMEVQTITEQPDMTLPMDTLTYDSTELPLEFVPGTSTSEPKTNEESIDPKKAFNCGGILEKDYGVLAFEDPVSLPIGYTCVWTIRSHIFSNLSLTLSDENFGVSSSKIRLTPMQKLAFEHSNHSSYQREWSAGNSGTTHTFVGPVFVELIVQKGGQKHPKFRILFSGTGDETTSGSTKIVLTQKSKPDENVGLLKKWSYATGDLFYGIVIVPHRSSGGVRLAAKYDYYVPWELDDCDGFLTVWKIGEQKDAYFRWCEGVGEFESTTDPVGFIILFRNYEGTAQFMFNYHKYS